MKIQIIGYGEIGKALHQVLQDKLLTADIHIRDNDYKLSSKVDYLHICYPYTWEFIDITNNYIDLYKPELTLVHATTMVGTCGKLNGSVVHAPIRGRHSDLARGIKEYPLYVGCDNSESAKKSLYCARWAGNPVAIRHTRSTELAKLLSLVQYAYNIEFWRYADKCCKEFGVDIEIIQDYTVTYNDIISNIENPDFCKTILTPPVGPIGGHCVLQSLEKLNAQVPEKIIQTILDTNKVLDNIVKE